ncbi:DEAD/DEAH box helicase family protein [Candidatus Formimonas warabiya]|uniref:Type III restriction endonuclease subunit R n=1 Tax=Formimonas warabiya TaxID=1761012 RepID=A0A3G1KW62_FORW1|nr:DEAD/DEAH box helicase family protein [Candidatus Formimonas warabiya]ATW26728.1 type III restriction endonuclease subunit R [Candidatus Formimonas warabiya]
MSFDSFEFKASYNKAEDDIAEGFYLPCMRASVRYDRISGFFGSTIYIIAWSALKEFIMRGGRMRLICSPYISDADEAALAEGYSARNNELLADAIKEEVEALFASPDPSAPARLLAYLVSEKIIDVKIAVPGDKAGADARRMFHDKVGVFSDGALSVGFRGSMNETFKGLSSDGNIESIDVFPSWADARDRERLETAVGFFARLWEGVIPGVAVYSFPSDVKAVLKDKAKGADWEQLLEEIKVTQSLAAKWKPDKRPGGYSPREHQTNALEAWTAAGRRGVFEHATGSGKTFTAMCAIRDAFGRGETVIVLVPSRDLLGQWYDELTKTIGDIKVYYLLCGDGHTEWRHGNTLTSWTSPGSGQNRVIISTMDTAASPDFIRRVAQGTHLFIVADEVHRLGSPERRKIFVLDTGARLGLSATPCRYGDPVGTQAIMDYFGGIIPPPFTLEDAIHAGVLTKYFYHPQKLSLTKAEQARWDEITEEVRKLLARSKGGVDIESTPRLKMLIINRARIVKNAAGKVPLALDVLRKNFKAGQKWIVYCDNIDQLKAVLHSAMAAGFDAYEYYAGMAGDRDMTISYFEDNGGVLVSIKCLDEGVDIPSTTHALILASSQNPREFIQRRGRILRRAKGKHFAELYDAITIPVMAEGEDEKSLSIITAELSRAIQFGESAENYSGFTDLKNIAAEFQIDFNTLRNGGLEDDDE